MQTVFGSRAALLGLGAMLSLAGCAQALGVDGPYVLGAGGASTSVTTSAGGSSGGGAEGGGCPAEVSPAGGSCPEPCTSCDEDQGICFVDCGGGCSGALACPDGYRCDVDCGTGSACEDLELTCGDGGCDVSCDGNRACDQLVVSCGAGPCELACGTGPNVCRGAVLGCGEGRCEATCAGGSQPEVSCGAACACSPCG